MESASIAADVAHEHDHHGPARPNVSSRVEAQFLGMLLFIISEVMLFGAFFTAYFFIRVVNDDPWPADGTSCRWHRGRQHGDPDLLELHDALGARGSEQRATGARMRAGLLTTFMLGLTFLIRADQRVRAHRLRAARQRPGHDLLRPHGPARRARLRRPDAAPVRDDPRLPRPLHRQGAPRRRGARASTGTSSTSCGSSCTHALHPLDRVLNPLRSEQEAFRFLIYVRGRGRRDRGGRVRAAGDL